MKRQEKGQTLIEVLVGLSAAVVVIAAITVAAVTSLNNVEYSRDQNLATHYAQEGMEIVRNMRDQNISSVSSSSLPDGTYCMAQGCVGLTSNPTDVNCGPRIGTHCTTKVGNFVREVTITHNDTLCNGNGPTPAVSPTTATMKVSVSTYWGDTKCTNSSNLLCHSVLLTTCLSDFTVVPTP